jgi:hypothetical protein
MLSPEKITIELTNREALVLFEWLARTNQSPPQTLFEDDAEARALSDLEALLEKVLTEPLDSRYKEYLAEARAGVRGA